MARNVLDSPHGMRIINNTGTMKIAPTYVVSLVGIIMAFQNLVGFDFTSDQWTMFILMLVSIFTALRQLIVGRSDLFGMRPDDETDCENVSQN